MFLLHEIYLCSYLWLWWGSKVSGIDIIDYLTPKLVLSYSSLSPLLVFFIYNLSINQWREDTVSHIKDINLTRLCFRKLPIMNLTYEPSHFGGYEWFLVENELAEQCGIFLFQCPLDYHYILTMSGDLGTMPFSVAFFYQQSTVVRLSKPQKYLLMPETFLLIFLKYLSSSSKRSFPDIFKTEAWNWNRKQYSEYTKFQENAHTF